jgi:NAD kinase
MDRITPESNKTTFTSPLILYKIVSEIAHRYAKLVFKFLLNVKTIEKIFVQKECYEAFYELTTEIDCDKVTVFSRNSEVDLAIIIGGDGTVLWCNSMFESDQARPPFLTFNLGTLGYMTYCSSSTKKKQFLLRKGLHLFVNSFPWI